MSERSIPSALRSLRQKLYLLLQLTRRDISARYRGSLMGLFWSFIGPMLLLLVYTFVFSVVFRARWGGDESEHSTFALNLFAGMLVHALVSECLARSPGLIAQHSSYVKRVVFPLWLLPLVVVGSALFHLLVSFLVLLGAMLLLGQGIPWQVLLLPVLLLPLLLLAVSVGWFFAALGVYVKDIAQMMPMLITVLMFLSPVFYPVEALPEAYQTWMYLNPLTPAIEVLRALLFHGQLPSVVGFLTYLAANAVLALLALWLFTRLRRGFADAL